MPLPIETVPAQEAADLDIRVRFYGLPVIDFRVTPGFLAAFGDGEGVEHGARQVVLYLHRYHFAPSPEFFQIMGWNDTPAQRAMATDASRNFTALASSKYQEAKAHGETAPIERFFWDGIEIFALVGDYSKTGIKL